MGVPAYDSLPPLPAVSENVNALRRLFADPAVWGLPAENILVPDLTGPDPLGAVMEALRSAAREATDTLLVYYAGHGLTNVLTGELILALPGAENLDQWWRALSFDHIRRGLTDPTPAAARRVVLLDCCYSALALAGDMGPAPASIDVAALTEVNGAYVLTACAESETAKAPPGARYTAFTGELITALEEGVADGPELLDLHTLYRHLAAVLAGKRWPVPQQRSRNSIGDLALARNRAWSAPAAASSGDGDDAGGAGPSSGGSPSRRPSAPDCCSAWATSRVRRRRFAMQRSTRSPRRYASASGNCVARIGTRRPPRCGGSPRACRTPRARVCLPRRPEDRPGQASGNPSRLRSARRRRSASSGLP